MKPCLTAKSDPAIPTTKAESEKESRCFQKTLMPSAPAAISFSRMAIQDRP